MVTRKPVPDNSAAPGPAIPHIQVEEPTPTQREPPEPWETFDSDVEDSDQDHKTKQEAQKQKAADGAHEHVPIALRPGTTNASPSYQALEEENVWVDAGRSTADTRNENHDNIERVPTVLRPGSGGMKNERSTEEQQGASEQFSTIPQALRPGGGAVKVETNPFKRKIAANATGSSASEHTTPQTVPLGTPVPLPSFSQLSLAEQNTNPWQPGLDERKETPPVPLVVPGIPEQDLGNGIWDSAKPSRQATPGPVAHSPALISLPSEESSAGWEDESRKPSLAAPLMPLPSQEVLEDSHAWDDLGNLDKGKTPAKPAPIVSGASTTASDDWNLIDVEAPPGPPPKQSAEDGTTPSTAPSTPPAQVQPQAPGLPPRRSAEMSSTSTSPRPPAQPPRPVDKSETYQIKKITWYDASAPKDKNPRMSPILVQNANGPCPLVALVNALSLTTPADQTNTALVEALRSRERISLGLLLDVVFDELMSERRTNPDAELPDVAELYEFLKGLHTGMNVNPRFIPTQETISLLKRTSLTHVHPTDRTSLIPGTFEHTKEMSLYATFSIPLIHGWLPSHDDAVYDAFSRQAASYEDTQNLLFREEELEDKLQSPHLHTQGLTEEEGQVYQDILTIKSFLSISATQLTPYGLDVIRQSMKPGSVAILFRNDHFGTLYRHPQTLELFILVTDAGYASHDEVVWESLVDVSGERAEFFSGDFRLVSSAQHGHGHGQSGGGAGGSYAAVASDDHGHGSHRGGEWTTVQGGRRTTRNQSNNNNNQQHQQRRSHSQPEDSNPPLSPSHEQEDRDLALALQLQEEEDERHRVEVARRRRESQLSEQFIEQQAGGLGGGQQPPSQGRFNGNNRGGAHGRGGHGGNGGANAIAPARRSSNAVNSIPISGSGPAGLANSVSRGGRGGGRGGAGNTNVGGRGGRQGTAQQQQQQQQTIRPLVPPTLPARNAAANRDPEAGVDDAPPSYEQASKQTPYVPPAGHPSHPASAPRNGAGGASTSSLSLGSSSPGPAGRGGRGGYPGQGRQGIRPPGAGAGGGGENGNGGQKKDRDCVVM